MQNVLIALALVCLAACGADGHAPQEPLPVSMKGWELTTWHERGGTELHFSLLVGTNRLKGPEEVYGDTLAEGLRGPRGIGADALLAALERLGQGAFVGWNLHPPPVPDGGELALPAAPLMAEVETLAKRRGLELHR